MNNAMKLYHSVGPNPRVVKMFLLEKGQTPKTEIIDIIAGDNRLPAFLLKNPLGQLPVLETPQGIFLSEITAICEYLNECYPQPSLIGTTAIQRAITRMWCRRIDLNINEPLTAGFRYSDGLAMFKDRLHCIPQAADDFKKIYQDNLRMIDHRLQHCNFIAGDNFTLADILLFCFIPFAEEVGQGYDKTRYESLARWQEQIAQRDSAKASAQVI